MKICTLYNRQAVEYGNNNCIIVSPAKESKRRTRQSKADPRLWGHHPEAPETTQLIKATIELGWEIMW